MAGSSELRLTDGQVDFSGGVDSGRVPTIQSDQNPTGLPRNQLAWLCNATVRGGGITQRTGWTNLATVNDGTAIYQGGFMYDATATGGFPYLVLSIGGHIYRVRVDTDNSVEDISIPGDFNPSDTPKAFFCQAERFLVIQAGDYLTNPVPTLPLFWDGVTMRRSNGILPYPGTSEIPPAGPMDYYMGRLWYAQGRQYTAGDIVQGPSGTLPYNFYDSVLKVTENPLAIGGDGFIVPTEAGNIRALSHTANLDTALGQGQLFVFTRKSVYSLDVPVTRADWIASTSNNQPLQKVVQINYGTSSDRSVVKVNGDMFYQTAEPAIRSLTLAVRYFQQWGNTQISNNEERLLNFNDRGLMEFGSGILWDNRLWQTALPVRTPVGVAHQTIAPLDFDIISSLGTKLPPAWEGHYEGLDFLQLFTGDFGGNERAFAVVHSRLDDSIQVWELTDYQRAENGDNRISWYVEFPAYTWADLFKLKKLDSAELWIDKLFGTVDFTVYYRPDQDPCWHLWTSWKECAARNSEEDVNNPASYPLLPYREQYRATKVFPNPPVECSVTGRPSNIGYSFQVKIEIKGWCRIRGLMAHALPVAKQPFLGSVCAPASRLAQSTVSTKVNILTTVGGDPIVSDDGGEIEILP